MITPNTNIERLDNLLSIAIGLENTDVDCATSKTKQYIRWAIETYAKKVWSQSLCIDLENE